MKIRSRLDTLILCLPAVRLISCPSETETGVNRVRKSYGGKSRASRAVPAPGWLRRGHASETCWIHQNQKLIKSLLPQ